MRKNRFYTGKNFVFLFFFLFYNVSINSAECGILKQVEDLLADQVSYNQSLQIIASLQDVIDKELESIIEILTPNKSLGLLYKNPARMVSKSTASQQVERGNRNVEESNDILFDSEGNQVTSITELRTIIGSQFSSIDVLADMQEKMDSITELLGTSTQEAADLDISLSDCEASLDDCCKSLELWNEYLNDIVVSPDDVFWTYIADE